MRAITELTLRELTALLSTVEGDEQSIVELFVNPRGHLLSLGVSVPMDAEIVVRHRDELRAALLTPNRFQKFAQEERDQDDSVIIHIKEPLKLKCGRIDIKCPKKDSKQSDNENRLISEMPLKEVFSLVHQLEQPNTGKDEVLDLKNHPTRFFHNRGITVPSDVRIDVGDTEELIKGLENERGINEFLKIAEAEPLVKAKSHIKGGLANCTWITYECEKSK
jgi:hypothetical protein